MNRMIVDLTADTIRTTEVWKTAHTESHIPIAKHQHKYMVDNYVSIII